MTTPKLKPCPFCGRKPKDVGLGCYRVDHSESCFLGQEVSPSLIDFANQKDWNRRAELRYPVKGKGRKA